MNVTAILLAGGKSSRMGNDKGLIEINGIPMISYLVDMLDEMNIPVIISTSNSNYGIFKKPLFSDIIPEKGPLGGIYTGLNHSLTDKNIVLSCDSPFITKEVIEQLLQFEQDAEIIYSSCSGIDYPLTGIYSRTLLPKIQYSLDNNQLRLKDFILHQKGEKIVFEKKFESCFINFNTQEDLEKIIR